MRRIDFYYWGTQCPISSEILDLLEAWKFAFCIRTYDVAKNPELAKQQHMFYPFLTIVDETKRYYGPIHSELLRQLLTKETVEERPYQPVCSSNRKDGILTSLTSDSYPMVCKGCTLGNSKEACKKKFEFLHTLSDDPIYGFLNLVQGEAVGGAEYVPSKNVPYDIPKDENTAFLTCLYHSSEQADYKTGPLQALEAYLSASYQKLIAVSDETGVFPNGPLSYFLSQGYTDCGVIFEESGYCKLHLVTKSLHKCENN